MNLRYLRMDSQLLKLDIKIHIKSASQGFLSSSLRRKIVEDLQRALGQVSYNWGKGFIFALRVSQKTKIEYRFSKWRRHI